MHLAFQEVRYRRWEYRVQICFLTGIMRRKSSEELYGKYPILKENRVILFAPTFRGDGNKDAYYPLEAFDVNHFMERQPEDTVLILKNHPFVKQKFTEVHNGRTEYLI